tara:strand:- start:1162 stop:1539 length:378 start_codon:yes stop_codon:yes gene_type:complete
MKSKIPFLLLFLLIIACQNENDTLDFMPGSPEQKGMDIFNRMACNACHSMDGTLKLGPTIKKQYGKEIRHTDGTIMVIDDEYIRESIIDPLKYIAEGYTPIMPSYKPILSDEEINWIIAYIKALK